MEEKLYISKLKEVVTVRYDYDEKTYQGTYNILEKGKVRKISPIIKGPKYCLFRDAYKNLFEIYYDLSDLNKYDYLIISNERKEDIELIDILNKYESLDYTRIVDQIDSMICFGHRIIYYNNEIIKVSSNIRPVYIDKFNKTCDIHYVSEMKTLKTI